MPSYLHEVLVEMFRGSPRLVADVLSGPLGIEVPEFERAELSSGDLTDVKPTELRADVVITLSDGETPVFAAIVEVQLKIDHRKRRTWPAYVATLHARLDCPVMLVVVCRTPGVANWAAKKIVVSRPGLELTPVVIGPGQAPVVVDVDLARRNPELVVLAAMANGVTPEQPETLQALVVALDSADEDRADLYASVVFAVLPQAARAFLRN